MLTLTIPARPIPADTPSLIATVYVVNWDPAGGVGGFEWRDERDEAEAFRRYLRDPTARVHVVALPEEVGSDVHKITDWLDAEGWSDGIDPRI